MRMRESLPFVAGPSVALSHSNRSATRMQLRKGRGDERICKLVCLSLTRDGDCLAYLDRKAYGLLVTFRSIRLIVLKEKRPTLFTLGKRSCHSQLVLILVLTESVTVL